jgi:hypothetical protein
VSSWCQSRRQRKRERRTSLNDSGNSRHIITMFHCFNVTNRHLFGGGQRPVEMTHIAAYRPRNCQHLLLPTWPKLDKQYHFSNTKEESGGCVTFFPTSFGVFSQVHLCNHDPNPIAKVGIDPHALVAQRSFRFHRSWWRGHSRNGLTRNCVNKKEDEEEEEEEERERRVSCQITASPTPMCIRT